MSVETFSVGQLVDALEKQIVRSEEAKVGFTVGLVFAEVSPSLAAMVLSEIRSRAGEEEAFSDIRNLVEILAGRVAA